VSAEAESSRSGCRDDELTVLLKSYELERLDDIQAASTLLGFVTVSIGLMSLLGFALVNVYERELRNSYPTLSAGHVPIPVGHTILGSIWVAPYGKTVIAMMAVPFVALYFALLYEAYHFAKRTEPELAFIGLAASALGVGVISVLFLMAMKPERVVQKVAGQLGRQQAL
jgi:hypothetical protein